MSGYHGWLYFKNEQTQERLACPAAAVERQRGRSGPRMALVFKSPLTGEVGEWDELRHSVWASKRVEEAREWSPVAFHLQDPEARAAIETAVAASIAELPLPESAPVSPDRRARRIRMDDWARGWGLDLAWDPFHNLEPNSQAKIQALQAAGAMPPPADQERLDAWLAQDPVAPTQPPTQAPIQAPIQAPAASVSAPAPAPAPAADPAADPAAPVSAAAEASPFGSEPSAAAAITPTPLAPAPAEPQPVAAEARPPQSEPAAPATPSESEEEATEEEEDEDELTREARSIFTGPDILSLAQIASMTGKRPASAPPAAREAEPAASAPVEAAAAPAPSEPAAPAAPAPLAFRCARLPVESAPGRPLWHTALFVCDSFLKKEIFEIVKKHWQGSHANGQKKTGLYTIDALQDLHAAGNAISLDGLLAGPAHLLAAADGARPLDAETFALHAFHQSPAPEARIIAARAKREIIWSRLGSLLSRMEPIEAPAAFEPARLCRDAASAGEGMGVWVDAARGIAMTQQWSDASEDAELAQSHRQSSDPRVIERLGAIARQMAALPESDPPAPTGESLYMTPFKAADISSKQEWKAKKTAAPAAGSAQNSASAVDAPAPRHAKMGA